MINFNSLSDSDNSQKFQEFFAACSNNDVETVRNLITQDYVNRVSYLYDKTPLYQAVSNYSRYGRDDTIIRMLLTYGAAPNQLVLDSSRAPIHLATQRGYFPIVKLLLEHDANPNLPNEHGETPLHLAAGLGFVNITEELLSYGANPNARTIYGSTPLHSAAFQEPNFTAALKDIPQTFELLLRAGANLTLKNNKGHDVYIINENNLSVSKLDIQSIVYRAQKKGPLELKIIKNPRTILSEFDIRNSDSKEPKIDSIVRMPRSMLYSFETSQTESHNSDIRFDIRFDVSEDAIVKRGNKLG